MEAILIVDDDFAVRAFLAAALTAAGYETHQAGSTREAMKILVEKQIDLAMLDVGLPDKSGRELLGELHGYSENLPIVMITGQPSIDAAVSCLKAGACDYLTKPIERKRLLEVVKEALKVRQTSVGQVADDKTLELSTEEMQLVRGYKILRRLGFGGQADVYLARSFIQGQPAEVALKVLSSRLQVNLKYERDVIERFAREAQMAMELEHPRLVKVYDYGVGIDGNTPYLAMEYVAGGSFRTAQNQLAPLSYVDKMRLIRQVAEALEVIHQGGHVHRDVKPPNILLVNESEVKLGDFGIAHMRGSDLTRDNLTVGTPAYMAPEAFLGRISDPRADLFSLGVVAYELCFGEPPFQAESFAVLAHRVQTDYPRAPRKYDPSCPAEVVHILGRLLKKNPDERYQSAVEVISDIDNYLTDGSQRTKNPIRFLRSRLAPGDWA